MSMGYAIDDERHWHALRQSRDPAKCAHRKFVDWDPSTDEPVCMDCGWSEAAIREKAMTNTEAELAVNEADNLLTVELTEWLIDHDFFNEDGTPEHLALVSAFGEVADQAFAAHRLASQRAPSREVGQQDSPASPCEKHSNIACSECYQ